MSLAENLRLLRKKEGMSQEELADAMGISRQAVSKWESGRTRPDMERTMALAAFFGVTVDALITDESAETKREVVNTAAGNRPKPVHFTAGILMSAVGLLAVLICHLAYGLADGTVSFETYLSSIRMPLPLYGMFWLLAVGGLTLLLSGPLAVYLGLRRSEKPPRLSQVAAALLLATAVLTAVTLAFVPSEIPGTSVSIGSHLTDYSGIRIDNYKAAVLLYGAVPLGAASAVVTVLAHRRLKKQNRAGKTPPMSDSVR